MTTADLRLEFDVAAKDPGVSSVQARELRSYILDAVADAKVDQDRGDKSAQDFGASLVVLLAAPSVVALAKGVARWLELRNSSKVTVRCGENKMVVENVTAKSAAELAESLRTLCE